MWTLQGLGKFAGLLPLVFRLLVGCSFAFVHGYEKVVPGGSFDGGRAFVEKTAGVAPSFLLYIGAWTEFLGGIAILAGLLTRWAAIGILAVMAYAIFGIHWPQGFAAHVHEGRLGGYEMAATYAALSLGILFLGPGPLSLDRLFFGKAALNP